MFAYLRNHHAGLLALFIALSGTSYAVATGSINSREIRNNSVTTRDLRNNSATGRDLRNGSVSGADLRDGSVAGVDVADNTLTGNDVANSSIGGDDVRNNSLGDGDLADNSVSGDEIRANSVRTEKVQNGTLRADDFAAGLLATDATVRFDNFQIASGEHGSGTVACGNGERAVGGGVSFAGAEDPDDIVTFSEPRAGADEPGTQQATATGWAGGVSNGGADERTARVWVVCASR